MAPYKLYGGGMRAFKVCLCSVCCLGVSLTFAARGIKNLENAYLLQRLLHLQAQAIMLSLQLLLLLG